MSGQQGLCRSCGAPVLWVETERGKKMPLDLESSVTGNVVLSARVGDGREIAVYVNPSTAELYVGRPHYTSHFATCPQAGQWRHK